MKVKIFHVISSRELEKLVTEVFGCLDYNFRAVQEAASYTCHQFEARAIIDIDDAEDVEQIRGGYVPPYRNDVVLDLLVLEGKLDPGLYLVEC
jgi:hypothetical protein